MGMKAMKAGAKAMTKGGLAEALATETEIKRSECMKIVNSLAGIATEQVKSAGKFVLPGICMVKTRLKPATKAGKREVFGKVMMVKAKPARTVVKAFCVSALRRAYDLVLVRAYLRPTGLAVCGHSAGHVSQAS